MIDFDRDIHIRTVDNEEDQTREVTAKLVMSSFQYASQEVAKNPEAIAVLTRVAKFNLWQEVYGDLYRQLIVLRNRLIDAGAIAIYPAPDNGINEAISKALAMIGPPSQAIAELVEALDKGEADARP